MNDRIRSTDQANLVARALWDIASLMAAKRVNVDADWSCSQPECAGCSQCPSVTGSSRLIVTIDVTGYPAERDTLISVLGRPAAIPWRGETGTEYRDWRGTLLTMHMLVTEQVSPVVPRPTPVPTCPGAPDDAEAACGEPGPHGPHPLGDEPPAEAEPVDQAEPAPLAMGPRPYVRWPANLGRDFAGNSGPGFPERRP